MYERSADFSPRVIYCIEQGAGTVPATGRPRHRSPSIYPCCCPLLTTPEDLSTALLHMSEMLWAPVEREVVPCASYREFSLYTVHSTATTHAGILIVTRVKDRQVVAHLILAPSKALHLDSAQPDCRSTTRTLYWTVVQRRASLLGSNRWQAGWKSSIRGGGPWNAANFDHLYGMHGSANSVRSTHTACAIVNSRKPGASNNATATLSQTQATAYLPAEPLRFFDMQGTPPHFHQPATLPVVDNAGHVCYCSQSNSSMQPTSPYVDATRSKPRQHN
ncbi:hypothetical protein EDD16DRAFT_1528400 [Pisolithus croceorrhizus]|nr:hypothetical protein EDD16DRAFT_1528400 [Pisolithus croceorrhizus]